MKLLPLIAFALTIPACSSTPNFDHIPLEMDIGWLHGNCLAIKNSYILPDKQFTLIDLNNHNKQETAKIIRKTNDSNECHALIEDRAELNKESGYYFYSIQTPKPVDLAIGILNADKKNLSSFNFSSCNTAEGINFLISKNNSTIWSGYYYLGYDMDPTCPVTLEISHPQ